MSQHSQPRRDGIQLLPGGFCEGLSLDPRLEQVWDQPSPRLGFVSLRIQISRKSKAGPMEAVGCSQGILQGAGLVWGCAVPLPPLLSSQDISVDHWDTESGSGC